MKILNLIILNKIKKMMNKMNLLKMILKAKILKAIKNSNLSDLKMMKLANLKIVSNKKVEFGSQENMVIIELFVC
jgi:hypothetical protein